ncbi:hypothetical protein [Aminobacter ciceronei]|uniref:hypothetical protein n=1 Tax=Aminobacter ciceronei TaxID=150723 RepID=UPI003F726C26
MRASRVAEGNHQAIEPSHRAKGQHVTAVVPRFRCIQEPNGSWQVWDDAEDQPAALGNTVLVERSFESATSACSILNRIYDGDFQLERPSRLSACPAVRNNSSEGKTKMIDGFHTLLHINVQ